MLLHSHSARAAARGALRTNRNSDRSKAFLSRLHRARVEPLESRHLLAVTVVTTTQDVLDPGDGLISLREAVIAANASPDDDEIQLPAGTYLLTIQGEETGATENDLDIENQGSLKIVGVGAGQSIIDATGIRATDETLFESRGGIFQVHEATATFELLTLQNGYALFASAISSSNGNVTIKDSSIVDNQSLLGAVASGLGELTVLHSTFANNVGGQGSAISSSGPLTVVDSTFTGNSSSFLSQAGAVTQLVGHATITGSTFSGNTANRFGGAITVGTSGSLELTNSTISDNSAGEDGGGIYNQGTLVSRHNTITGNRVAAGKQGGGLFLAAGSTTTLEHTIVAGNLRGAAPGGTPNDIQGPGALSASFSLIGDPATAGGLVNGTNGNIVGDGLGGVLDINTVLDTTLADNGGPTLTHKLVPGSPAINAGNPAFVHPPEFDQRGEGFPRVIGGRVDIGAYESLAPSTPVDGVIIVDIFEDIIADDGLWSLREAVIYANNDPSDNEIVLAEGTYLLSILGEDEDAALTGNLNVLDNGRLKIVGAGSSATTIDASPLASEDRGGMFQVHGAAFDIESVTLTGGAASRGGLIFTGGELTVAETLLRGGLGSAILGGLIFNAGNMSLLDCTLEGGAAGTGTAVYNEGVAILQATIVSGNQIGGEDGGAVYNHVSAQMTILDSVLSHNKGNIGSAILNGGQMTVNRSTISNNRPAHLFFVHKTSGAVFNDYTGTLTITESALTDNLDFPGVYNNRGTLKVVGSTLSGHAVVPGSSPNENYGGAIHSNFGNVTIENSTFSDNHGRIGGAIYVSSGGQATITDSTFTSNSSSGNGGAIGGGGQLTISRSTFTGNMATDGGAIGYGTSVGPVLIDSSTFSGNKASGDGGAIHPYLRELVITNSTFSGNSAGGNGGGIHVLNQFISRHNTITGNRAASGGGIFLASNGLSAATLEHTIVAGNFAGAEPSTAPSDIEGTGTTSAFYSLIGDPATAGGLVNGVNGNIVGDGLGGVLDINTVLDTTLSDNGGPTLTHKLVPGSPAINAGNPAFVPPPEFDQRGLGFARVTGGRIDIGAYEFGSVPSGTVLARHVFYNNSIYDGHDAGINLADNDAIDPSKQALLPGGGLAGPQNVTSYSRGINGIIVDIAGSHPAITAADFTFRVGATNDPDSWAAAPAPSGLAVFATATSTRVVITWADGAILNTYLQVIVAANANTDLTEADVFFFGNRIGDTFNNVPPATFVANAVDEIAIRNAMPANDVPVTSVFDLDKNGRLDAIDVLLARANRGFLNRIEIAPPLAPLGASSGGASSSALNAVAVALAISAAVNDADTSDADFERAAPGARQVDALLSEWSADEEEHDDSADDELDMLLVADDWR